MAIALNLPYVAVNHLEAHALTARLPGLFDMGLPNGGLPNGGRPDGGAVDGGRAGGGAPFPYLLLLVSGGHCQCVSVEGVGQYRRLGATVDDAAGEAFDKVGKLLGLGWPGGPELERLAASGDAKKFMFPRPMLGRAGCDFSFSGLKTAVAQTVARLPGGLSQAGALPRQTAADIAAGFQAAVTDVLADRASHAMAMLRGKANLLVVAGGVAANQAVRGALDKAASANGFRLLAPPPRLCTDNAVMVAWAGLERLRLGLVDGIDFAPRPRWPLESLSS
jgi:N6-L-threonylcarbamoyladenine synthase